MARVRRIEAVCARHGVRLPTAALQFPLGHPAVASVVVGMRAPAEVATNIEVFAPEVPADFWAELKAEGLLREDAPTPQTLAMAPCSDLADDACRLAPARGIGRKACDLGCRDLLEVERHRCLPAPASATAAPPRSPCPRAASRAPPAGAGAAPRAGAASSGSSTKPPSTISRFAERSRSSEALAMSAT